MSLFQTATFVFVSHQINQTDYRLCMSEQLLADFPVLREVQNQIIFVFYFFKVTHWADSIIFFQPNVPDHFYMERQYR